LELRRAEQQTAALDYQQTVLRAWHEIDDALAGFTAAQQRLDRLAEAARQNQTALDAAETQYRQGSATYLHVLTAQTALIRTQAQQTEAATAVALSVVSLYKALGGGWE
jgi:outer membrane protein TolC